MLAIRQHIVDLGLATRDGRSRWCNRVTDIGLVGVFFVTALALGGRHDLGRLVYAASVAVSVLGVVLRALVEGQRLRLPAWPVILTVASVLVVLAQLVPLSPAVRDLVAPGHSLLLPMWESGSPLGEWTTISLTPAESIEGLALILTHALLFFALINRLEGPTEIKRLFAIVSIVAFAMAVIAALQHVFGNGRLLWVYEYPFRHFGQTVQGTFTNRNHLAHFLGFGAAALLPFLLWQPAAHLKPGRQEQRDRDRILRLAALAAFVGLLATLVATTSRGGVASLTVGIAVGVTARWAMIGFRLRELLALVATIAAVLGAVSLYDYDRVAGRLDDLVSGEVDQLDASNARRLIWAANADAFLANPWFGHGAGSHRSMYPAYISAPNKYEFTHAESGYLQVASENGLGGLGILALALGTLFRWIGSGMRRSTSDERTTQWTALLIGLTLSVTHSVVDFVWYVPSLAAMLIAFAAVAYRLRAIQEGEEAQAVHAAEAVSPSPPSTAWGLRGAFAVAGATAAVTTLAGPAAGSLAWDRYVRVGRTVRSLNAEAMSVAAQHDPHLHATIENRSRHAGELLHQTLAADPHNARASSRLATSRLAALEQMLAAGANPMSLDSIRDVARSGGFSDRAEFLRWMSKVFEGSVEALDLAHHSAERAVRLGPLQGEAYLRMASVAFRYEGGIDLDAAIEQAVRLRPYDGRVHYEAGRQLHGLGRIEEAFEHYRTCINLPGSHRLRLISTLSTILPAKLVIEELHPDYAATELMLACYRGIGNQEDLLVLADHASRAAQAIDEGSDALSAARRWRQVCLVNQSLGRWDEAIESAQRAYELTPTQFWVRHDLAGSFRGAGRLDEAEPHTRWCLSRRPDLRHLQIWLTEAVRARAVDKREQRLQGRIDRIALLKSSPPAASVEVDKLSGESDNKVDRP